MDNHYASENGGRRGHCSIRCPKLRKQLRELVRGASDFKYEQSPEHLFNDDANQDVFQSSLIKESSVEGEIPDDPIVESSNTVSQVSGAPETYKDFRNGSKTISRPSVVTDDHSEEELRPINDPNQDNQSSHARKLVEGELSDDTIGEPQDTSFQETTEIDKDFLDDFQTTSPSLKVVESIDDPNQDDHSSHSKGSLVKGEISDDTQDTIFQEAPKITKEFLKDSKTTLPSSVFNDDHSTIQYVGHMTKDGGSSENENQINLENISKLLTPTGTNLFKWPHDSCDKTCPMKDYMQQKREEAQAIVDRYYLNKGFKYFEDICTCSTFCMMNCLKRDYFVQSLVKSIALFGIGVISCKKWRGSYLSERIL